MHTVRVDVRTDRLNKSCDQLKMHDRYPPIILLTQQAIQECIEVYFFEWTEAMLTGLKAAGDSDISSTDTSWRSRFTTVYEIRAFLPCWNFCWWCAVCWICSKNCQYYILLQNTWLHMYTDWINWACVSLKAVIRLVKKHNEQFAIPSVEERKTVSSLAEYHPATAQTGMEWWP